MIFVIKFSIFEINVMNNRIIEIVLTDLSLDNLKLQEQLEKEINSGKDLNDKVLSIKNTLKSLVDNEIMITKFQQLVSQTNNNNNLNQKEDGKI